MKRFIVMLTFKDGMTSSKRAETLNEAIDVYTYCPRSAEITNVKIFDEYRVDDSNPEGLAFDKWL